MCQKLTEIVGKPIFISISLLLLLLFLTGRYRYSLERASHLRGFPHRCWMRHRPGAEGGPGRAEGQLSEAIQPLVFLSSDSFNTDFKMNVEELIHFQFHMKQQTVLIHTIYAEHLKSTKSENRGHNEGCYVVLGVCK